MDHLQRITISPHLFFVAITQWRFAENDRANSGPANLDSLDAVE
jgi:hypothetical protein